MNEIKKKSAANKRRASAKKKKKATLQQVNDKWLRTKLSVVDGA
tara:strand:+ start:533 stop:664 length:132 start_codon:yes stop_codon:yes gene_type:complete